MTKVNKVFSIELTATTTEQFIEVPPLTKLSILNWGTENVDINFDNLTTDVTKEKVITRPNVPYEVAGGFLRFQYKAVSGSQGLQLLGTRINKG